MPDDKTSLPLTPAMFHILLSLAGCERHGYGIMQEVTAMTAGAMRIGPGTLYGTLKRLVAVGWVAESEERPDLTSDDERRRYYRLTETGRYAAEAEAERLDHLVRAARMARLLPSKEGEGV